jgi:predicted TIM-barrel fold metal-dependent hydrolase
MTKPMAIDNSDLPWVISVDDHVVEPPTVWTDRLPASVHDRCPRVIQDTCETIINPDTKAATYKKGGDGPLIDWWAYEDVLRPMPQVMACAGFPPEEMTLAPIPYSKMRPGCYDRDARIADMDINRTERSLCFPSFSRFAGQIFMEAKDMDLALLGVRAYNDWMVEEWCGPSGGRLIPLCLIPLWDAKAAAIEVRRNAARGCTAVAFTELPEYLGLPTIHDADGYWDPFFDACNETGTTINMHIGSGSKMPTSSSDAPQAVGVALTSLNAYMSMADWLLSGVLARYPKLKIAFSESQVGWMPFLMSRVDHVYMNSGAWVKVNPAITELPSSYIPGRVFGCFFDDMVGVDARYEIGIGQLVFETDYPHQDTTWPNTPDLVRRIGERVKPGELEMLVRTNAITMLGLDPTSLVPVGAAGSN